MKGIIFFFITFFAISSFANLQFSPWSIDFGQVDVDSGRVAYDRASLRNVGFEDIRNIYVYDDCYTHFRVIDYCTFLNPGMSCTVQVEYRPRSEGYHSCRITAQGGQGTYDTLRVSGRGVRDR